jgi:TfoX/Sxy family transcriptional regulator of competence genes
MRLSQKGREKIGSPMVSGYIKALGSLLATATSELDREVKIECKHFFGGAAAYANGCIFMTLTGVGVALKLPEESRAEITHLGGMPLRYFPKGLIKKDYVIVPDRIARDGDAISPWIIKSVSFSQTFPKPR